MLVGTLVSFQGLGFIDLYLLDSISKALNFTMLNMDSLFSSIEFIIGFILSLYGFFFDPIGGAEESNSVKRLLRVSSRRFEDRELGLKTKKIIECDRPNCLCAA